MFNGHEDRITQLEAAVRNLEKALVGLCDINDSHIRIMGQIAFKDDRAKVLLDAMDNA